MKTPLPPNHMDVIDKYNEASPRMLGDIAEMMVRDGRTPVQGCDQLRTGLMDVTGCSLKLAEETALGVMLIKSEVETKRERATHSSPQDPGTVKLAVTRRADMFELDPELMQSLRRQGEFALAVNSPLYDKLVGMPAWWHEKYSWDPRIENEVALIGDEAYYSSRMADNFGGRSYNTIRSLMDPMAGTLHRILACSAVTLKRSEFGDKVWYEIVAYTSTVLNRHFGVNTGNATEIWEKSTSLMCEETFEPDQIAAAFALHDMMVNGQTNYLLERDATSSFAQIMALVMGCVVSALQSNAIYTGEVSDLWLDIGRPIRSDVHFSYLRDMSDSEIRKTVKKPGTPKAYLARTKTCKKALLGCGTNPESWDMLEQSDTEMFTEAYQPWLSRVTAHLESTGSPVNNMTVGAEAHRFVDYMSAGMERLLPGLSRYNDHAKACAKRAIAQGGLPLPLPSIGGHVLVEPDLVRTKEVDDEGKILTHSVKIVVTDMKTGASTEHSRKVIDMVRNDSPLRNAPKRTVSAEAKAVHAATNAESDPVKRGTWCHDAHLGLAPFCPEADRLFAGCLYDAAMDLRRAMQEHGKILGVPLELNAPINRDRVVRTMF